MFFVFEWQKCCFPWFSVFSVLYSISVIFQCFPYCGKIPDRKINFCSKFVIKLFSATLLMLTLEVWSLSIHSFKKWLYHMLWWIWTKSFGPNYNEIFSFLTKAIYKHFRQRVDAILDDVSVHVAEIIVQCLTISLKTTIFQCSKNYVSPTRVTRLKVAPNTADPISLFVVQNVNWVR